MSYHVFETMFFCRACKRSPCKWAMEAYRQNHRIAGTGCPLATIVWNHDIEESSERHVQVVQILDQERMCWNFGVQIDLMVHLASVPGSTMAVIPRRDTDMYRDCEDNMWSWSLKTSFLRLRKDCLLPCSYSGRHCLADRVGAYFYKQMLSIAIS